MYDSKVARWFVQDPLSEKYYAYSPYNYCMNNPVMFVYPDGKAPGPGDKFATMRDAAIDWGLYYNGASILYKTEMASIIYEITNNGVSEYAYTKAANLGPHGGNIKIKSSGKSIAFIHSHGNYDGIVEDNNGNKYLIKDNEFSPTDMSNNKRNGLIGYISVPNGSLIEYNPNEDKIDIISTNLPSDPKDPSRLNNKNPTDNTSVFNKLVEMLKELLKYD